MPDNDDLEAQLAKWDAALRRDDGASDTDTHVRVADALVNKGHVLIQLGRQHDALTCFAEFLERFDDPAADAEQVAYAPFEKGRPAPKRRPPRRGSPRVRRDPPTR
jgi:hypothetical protein